MTFYIQRVPYLWGIFFIYMLMLSGCAVKGKGSVLHSESDASIWSAYKEYAQIHKNIHPYRIRGVLLLYSGGSLKRSSAIMWSNGVLPIRLDIVTGLGVTVARIREDEESTVVYSPSDKEAIIYNNNEEIIIGDTYFPFRLRELVAMLHGDFYTLFGDIQGTATRNIGEDAIEYSVSGGKAKGQLVLSVKGQPLQWEDIYRKFILSITYDDKTALPKEVAIWDKKDSKVVFRVKSRQILEHTFTAQQLQLKIPAGVSIQY